MGKKSRTKARSPQGALTPREAKSRPQAGSGERLQLLLVCALLAAVTLAIYAGVGRCGYVNLDDPLYVTTNAHTLKGLSWDNIGWAFTAMEASNWHPVTWLSYMVDVELFGVRAAPQHWVNLFLHILNALLLLLVLRRATGVLGPSALVAFLFALHPLHVESVAWIAERKDVLSTLFWLLATAAYLEYVRRPSAPRYLVLLAAFAMGLMTKPMLVTFPVTLLLLDLWPLERAPKGDDPARWSLWGKLLLEKAPLFALSALSSLVTLQAQRVGHSLAPLEALSLASRLENAVVSYARYLGATLFPVDLAVFYPAPEGGWGLAAVVGASALLLTLSVAAFLLRKRCPYVAVGWLGYLVTLLPVIGLVQVGLQARADRYTYVPLTGLFVAAVWGAAALCDRFAVPKLGRIAASVALLLPLALAARAQVGWWTDSVTLLEHSMKVTGKTQMVEMNLAAALSEAGQESGSLAHSLEVLRRNPDEAAPHFNVGVSLMKLGRFQEAVAEYRKALEYPSPQKVEGAIRCDLALSLINLGQLDEALAQYDAAVPLTPGGAGVLVSKGLLLNMLRRPSEALPLLEKAVALDPTNAAVYYNYGLTLDGLGRPEEAVRQFRKALELGGNPNVLVDANVGLATGLSKLGKLEEALPYYDAALALSPDDLRALVNKGRTLNLLNRRSEAEVLFRRAASLGSGSPGAPPTPPAPKP